MILADGMLGQMMEPVVLPEPKNALPDKPWATCGHKNQRAHNVVNSLYLTADDLERLNVERFARYEDIKRARAARRDVFDRGRRRGGGGVRRLCARRPQRGRVRPRGRHPRGACPPITLWPFPTRALEATVGTAKAYLTVEMNMGQMVDDVRLVLAGRAPVEFYGRTGGVIPTPAEVLAKIRGDQRKGG